MRTFQYDLNEAEAYKKKAPKFVAWKASERDWTEFYSAIFLAQSPRESSKFQLEDCEKR